MTKIETTFCHVVQRLGGPADDMWIDTSPNFYGEDGIVVAESVERDTASTFGRKNVRVVRRDTTVTETVIKTTDVHTEHCCIRHGCKYGDDDCTVESGLKPQSFRCEQCDWELAKDGGLEMAYLLNEMFERGRMRGYDQGLDNRR